MRKDKEQGYIDPRDAYLVAIIQLALLDIERDRTRQDMAEGLGVLSPEDQAKADAYYERTKDKFVAQAERKLRREKRRGHLPAKIIEIAACIVLIVGISAPFAIANVEAIRVRVLKLLIEFQEDHADLSLVEDEEASFEVPEAWQGDYYPSYIPDGFTVASMFKLENMVRYENEAGDFIEFDELSEDTETGLDTENASLSDCTVNGQTALVVEKDGETTIVWSEDEKYFIVCSSLSQDETLRVAESVKLIGN